MTNEEYQEYKRKHYKDESLFQEQKAAREKQCKEIINRMFAVLIFTIVAIAGAVILILALRIY